MAEQFNVVVIGGGPGGYVAAIRAAQLGFSVAVVEMERLGGICLNWGCIPTKALLQSAHLLEEIKHANEFGISTENSKADFPLVISRSRKVADQMAKGVEFLMKKNKITVINGKAIFKDKNTIQVLDQSSNPVSEVIADRFIVATGARSKPFPGILFDKKLVLSSREAMQEQSAPKKLGIIGAGAIGVEFADFYASMGSEVHIIEYFDHLLPNEDVEISKVLENSFKKRGIKQYLGKSVSGFEGFHFILHEMTAEDNRVSLIAESKGKHASGRLYNNHYHFLVTIVDGKITKVKEYLDTEHATWIDNG